MAAIPMHKAVLKIDATPAATTLTDMSSGVRTLTLNMTKNASQFHTIGTAAPDAVEGGYMWSVDMGVLVDISATSPYKYLADAVLTTGEYTVEVYTPDASTGSIKYAGEAIIQNGNSAVSGDGGSGNPMVASFNALGAGALAKSVVA